MEQDPREEYKRIDNFAHDFDSFGSEYPQDYDDVSRWCAIMNLLIGCYEVFMLKPFIDEASLKLQDTEEAELPLKSVVIIGELYKKVGKQLRNRKALALRMIRDKQSNNANQGVFVGGITEEIPSSGLYVNTENDSVYYNGNNLGYSGQKNNLLKELVQHPKGVSANKMREVGPIAKNSNATYKAISRLKKSLRKSQVNAEIECIQLSENHSIVSGYKLIIKE